MFRAVGLLITLFGVLFGEYYIEKSLSMPYYRDISDNLIDREFEDIFTLEPKESLYLYLPSRETLKIVSKLNQSSISLSYSIDGTLFTKVKLNFSKDIAIFDKSILYNSIIKLENISDSEDVEFSLFKLNYLKPKIDIYQQVDLNYQFQKINREGDSERKEFIELSKNRELKLKFNEDLRVKIEHRVKIDTNQTLNRDYYMHYKIDSKEINQFFAKDIDKFNRFELNSNEAQFTKEGVSYLSLKEGEELEISCSRDIYIRILRLKDYLLDINKEELKFGDISREYIELARDNRVKESAIISINSLEQKLKEFPSFRLLETLKDIADRFTFHRDLLPFNSNQVREYQFLSSFLSDRDLKLSLNQEQIESYPLAKSRLFKLDRVLKYKLPKREVDTYLRVILKYRDIGEFKIFLNGEEFEFETLLDSRFKKFIHSSIPKKSKNFAVVKIPLPKEIDRVSILGDSDLEISIQYQKSRDFEFLEFDYLTKEFSIDKLLNLLKSSLNPNYEAFGFFESEILNQILPLTQKLKESYERFFKPFLDRDSKEVRDYIQLLSSAKRYRHRDIFKTFKKYSKLAKATDRYSFDLVEFERFKILLKLREEFFAKQLLREWLYFSSKPEILAKAINLYLDNFQGDEIALFGAILNRYQNRIYLKSFRDYLYSRGSHSLYRLSSHLLKLPSKEELFEDNISIVQEFDSFEVVKTKSGYIEFLKSSNLEINSTKPISIEIRAIHKIENFQTPERIFRVLKIKDGDRIYKYPIDSKISQDLENLTSNTKIGDREIFEIDPTSDRVQISFESKDSFLARVKTKNSPASVTKLSKLDRDLIDLELNLENSSKLLHRYYSKRESSKQISRIEYSWRGVDSILSNEGIEYRFQRAFKPFSPYLKIRKALVDRDFENILLPNSEVNFLIQSSKERVLNFQLDKVELSLLEDRNISYCYEFYDKRVCSNLEDRADIQIPISEGETLISFYLNEASFNDFIAIELLNSKIVKEPIKKSLYISSLQNPVKFYSNGINLYRIYREEGDRVEISYLLSEANVRENSIYPLESESLVRVDKLVLKEATESLLNLDFTLSQDSKYPKQTQKSYIDVNESQDSTQTIRVSFDSSLNEDDEELKTQDERYEFALIHRYYSKVSDTYFKSELLYRDNSLFGFKEKILQRISNYPISYTLDFWFLSQEINSEFRNLAYLKLSQVYFQKFNENLTNSINISAFGRYLSEKSYLKELDRDIFSEYKLNHRYGLSLSDTFKYSPFIDTLLISRFKLNTNENFNLDNYYFQFEIKQLIENFQIDLGVKFQNYLKDRDRGGSYSRTYLEFNLLYELYLESLNRLAIELNLKRDLDSEDIFTLLLLKYDFNSGKLFEDYIPYEIDFLNLRELDILSDD